MSEETVVEQDAEEQEDPIAAAWEDIKSRMLPDEDDAPGGELAKKSDEPAGEKERRESAQRARDEQGRFAKQQEPAPQTDATPAVAVSESTAQDAWDVNRPPSSLSPSAKAEWDKLPETWRREIHRREADMHRGVSQIMPDARFGQAIKQAAEPYRAMIEASGHTPESAIIGLLRADTALRTGTPAQRQQLLAQLARDYGIELPSGQQQEPQSTQQFQDPRVDALLAAQQQYEQQRFAAEKTQKVREIESWMNETGADGKPLRPFVDNVHTEIMALLPVIEQRKPGASTRELMEEAYRVAVWANPATRALEEQKRIAEIEAARKAENLRKAEEARKAASVNVPRRGVVPQKPAQPIDDFIADQAKALGLIA